MAEKVLEHINETIREQEGRERLKEISKDLWVGQGCVLVLFSVHTPNAYVFSRRLDLTAPTRYMGPRKLLKEGILLKAKSGRKLRAFLCSDILVLTEETTKSLYRMVCCSVKVSCLVSAQVRIAASIAGRSRGSRDNRRSRYGVLHMLTHVYELNIFRRRPLLPTRSGVSSWWRCSCPASNE